MDAGRGEPAPRSVAALRCRSLRRLRPQRCPCPGRGSPGPALRCMGGRRRVSPAPRSGHCRGQGAAGAAAPLHHPSRAQMKALAARREWLSPCQAPICNITDQTAQDLGVGALSPQAVASLRGEPHGGSGRSSPQAWTEPVIPAGTQIPAPAAALLWEQGLGPDWWVCLGQKVKQPPAKKLGWGLGGRHGPANIWNSAFSDATKERLFPVFQKESRSIFQYNYNLTYFPCGFDTSEIPGDLYLFSERIIC